VAGSVPETAALGLPPDMPAEVRHRVTFEAGVDQRTKLAVTEYDWPVGQMMEMARISQEQCLNKMAGIFVKG
jgi:hypothetical protein